MENLKRNTRRLQNFLIVIFISLSIGIIALESVFYHYRAAYLKEQEYQQLSAISDSKRDRIVMWYKNRENLVQSIVENPFIRESLLQWIKEPGDKKMRDKILAWMNGFSNYNDFSNLSLIDPKCKILLSQGNNNPCDSDMEVVLGSVLKTGQIKFSDLHRTKRNDLQIDVLAPLIDTSAKEGRNIFAVLDFQIDPDKVLLPLIETWPTQSRSAETLILRKQGDRVLYLNELRHKKNTALNFSLPISSPDLLSAKGLRNGDGIYEGIDYRNVPCLGIFRSIPGTSWYIVSKIDKNEVIDPLNKLSFKLIFVAVILIVLAGACTSLLYHSQNSRYFQSLYNSEQKLRQSEQRFRSIIENTHAGYFFIDQKGLLQTMNRSWLDMYGYEESQIKGHHFSEFQVENDLEQSIQIFESILKGDIAFFQGEFSRKRRDGTIGYHTFSAQPVIQNSETIGMEGFLIDITERRMAVESLRISESFLRQSQRLATVGHFSFDTENGLWTSSEILNEIFGIDESYPKTVDGWLSLIHPKQRDEIKTYLEDHVLKENKPFNKEYRIIRKSDSVIRWVQCRSEFESEKNGGAVKMFGVLQDITERKDYEATIDAERERLHVTLKSIGDGVITTDTEGCVVLMNAIAENLTGWPQNEAEGKPLSEVFYIVNEYTGVRCENPVDRVLKEGIIVELANHTKLIARDGRNFILADSGSPIRDSNGNIIGVVLVFRDITEKQRIDENLQQSQRIESLGVLAGGIAHDFNNMLSGLFGYLDMGKFLAVKHGIKEIEVVMDKSLLVYDRARSLTRQLLTFAKGGEPVRSTTNISNLLKNCISFVSSGSFIRVKTELNNDLMFCDVDENQISQVIDNILINAQQAMPNGGVITVSASNASGTSEDGKTGNYVKISIADTGIGIPQKYLNKIFDPFFTTKQQGSGLGLATSYSIIKKHDGWIDVKSKMEEGAVFTIFLPAIEKIDIPEPQLTSEKPEQNVTPVQKRVLVMDDESYIQDIAIMVLNTIECDIEVASDGDEAVDKFLNATELGKPFSMIILDLTVPGKKGGKEVVMEIRQKDPGVILVASSGYSNDPVMAKPGEFGFNFAFPKPYRRKELIQFITNILK